MYKLKNSVMPVRNVAITGPDGVAPIWPPGAPRSPIMGQEWNGDVINSLS